MLDRALVFLDLETTGATAHSDRITEIGLVEVDKGRHIGEWSSLVNPERPIPPLIESLTGITDAMVAKAPTFADLARDLYRRLAGKTLVAHNARFDFGFLQSEFRRVGLKFGPDVLCTVRLSRRLYPQERRHNLDSLIARHGLACDNRHRALADARVLWEFTQRIHQDLEATEINDAVADQLKKPQLPPALPQDLPDRIPESPGVYAFYSQSNVALHVGKSANLRSRVLSHFGSDKRPAWRASAEISRVEWDVAAGELGMQIRHHAMVETAAAAAQQRSLGTRRNSGRCNGIRSKARRSRCRSTPRAWIYPGRPGCTECSDHGAPRSTHCARRPTSTGCVTSVPVCKPVPVPVSDISSNAVTDSASAGSPRSRTRCA